MSSFWNSIEFLTNINSHIIEIGRIKKKKTSNIFIYIDEVMGNLNLVVENRIVYDKVLSHFWSGNTVYLPEFVFPF